MIADMVFHGRGKSELHRVGRWVTPSGGDPKESATERYRQIPCSVAILLLVVRIAFELSGKDGKVR